MIIYSIQKLHTFKMSYDGKFPAFVSWHNDDQIEMFDHTVKTNVSCQHTIHILHNNEEKEYLYMNSLFTFLGFHKIQNIILFWALCLPYLNTLFRACVFFLYLFNFFQ